MVNRNKTPETKCCSAGNRVRVKGYDQRGIIWFTNYASRKGHKLAGAVADCIGSGYQ